MTNNEKITDTENTQQEPEKSPRFPLSQEEALAAIIKALDAKMPVIVSEYSEDDAEQDIDEITARVHCIIENAVSKEYWQCDRGVLEQPSLQDTADIVRFSETDGDTALCKTLANAVESIKPNPFISAEARKRKQIVIGAVAAVAVVAVAFGGVALASQPKAEPAPPPAQEQKEADDAKVVGKSTVKLTLAAPGAQEGVLVKVSVAVSNGGIVVQDKEMALNEETTLGEFEPGVYELRMAEAAEAADGTTYALPKTHHSFQVWEIKGADKYPDTAVKIEMVATEAQEKVDEAEPEMSTTPAAAEGAAPEEANADNGSAGNSAYSVAPSSGTVDGGGASIPAQPDDPAPQPDPPAPAPQPDVPAPVEPSPAPEPVQPEPAPAPQSYSVWITSDGREFDSAEACGAWMEQNALNGNRLTSTVVTRYR